MMRCQRGSPVRFVRFLSAAFWVQRDTKRYKETELLLIVLLYLVVWNCTACKGKKELPATPEHVMPVTAKNPRLESN
jgi:hypothetical protein